MIGGIETGLCAAHEIGQLFVDDLDNHLRGSQAFHHLRADRPFCHGSGEILRNLVVDVGFQQRHAHLAHRVLDVGFRERAFASQSFKGGLQSFGKTFKCHNSFFLIM